MQNYIGLKILTYSMGIILMGGFLFICSIIYKEFNSKEKQGICKTEIMLDFTSLKSVAIHGKVLAITAENEVIMLDYCSGEIITRIKANGI